MWRHQEVTASSIEAQWMAIKDRFWAAESCLTSLAASEGCQRLLLQAGLHETQAALSSQREQSGTGPSSHLKLRPPFQRLPALSSCHASPN